MDPSPSIPRRAVLIGVTCLGISSLVTQVLVLRAFLGVLAGNELVLGLILGNWLLLTGAGSLLGRRAGRLRHPLRWLLLGQAVVALLPPLQLAGIRHLKTLFPPGLMLGVEETFLASLLLLLPYCLTAGFLLTQFAGLASRRRDAAQIGQVYALDTLGGIVGGLLFSTVLVYRFTPFQTATFLLILNLLAALLLAHVARRARLALAVLAVLAAAAVAIHRLDPERRTAAAMFPGLELLAQRTTPYGSLAVTRQGSQVTVFENGLPLGSSQDRVAAEEMVHYALAQRADPRRVLMLSGGLHGAHREIEKYGVQRIDYVELDPAVLELARQVAGMRPGPGLRLVAQDARRFVKQARARYDAVLMDLPDPATAQLNRFYTVEFFSEVRRALRPGGVFSFGLRGAQNYADPELRRLASAVYRALTSVFDHVLIVPGGRMVLVASQGPLHEDVAARLQARGIRTDYVNADYLAARMTPDRLAAAREMVSLPVAANRDFRPVSYYAHLRYWLARFGDSLLLPALLLAGLAILVAVLLAHVHRRSGGWPAVAVAAALGASGFTGMGLEVVLLIAFQVTYGYVYQQVGILAAAFLAGAAVGAAWSGRRAGERRRLMFRLDALLAATALLLAPVLAALHGVDDGVAARLVPTAFALLNGAVGLLVGAQLPVAARLVFAGVEETAGQVYAFDLLGASAGGLVVGVFCLPWLGIAGTCALLGGLKLATAVLLRWPAAATRPVPAAAPRGSRDVGFGLALFALVALGLVAGTGGAGSRLYALTFTPAYRWMVAGLLGWGIAAAMGARMPMAGGHGHGPGARVGVGRWLGFAVFGTAVFYPVFRCFYSVPWLFCHVCPRPCVFGTLRPWLVPAALIANLENKHWCHHRCPVATLGHCQAFSSGRPRRMPRWAKVVSLAVLALTAVTYFVVAADAETRPPVHDWFAFFYQGSYAVNGVVLGAAVLLIAAGHRWRRPFCEMLCPVGAFSDLPLGLERRLDRAEKRRKEAAHAA